MNQRSRVFSDVPVLPATCRSSSLAAMPVPPVTTRCSIQFMVSATSLSIARLPRLSLKRRLQSSSFFGPRISSKGLGEKNTPRLAMPA